MKKIIKRKTYSTENSEIVSRKAAGEWGDSAGYEEILYKTPKNEYFIYGVGGEESKYPQEDIIPVTTAQAKAF